MTPPRPLRDAGLAFSLLSFLPTTAALEDGESNGAAAWFPVVGLALGSVVWAIAHGLRTMGWQTTGAYAVAGGFVVLWAVLTRMLHWDGLADVADGMWGGHTPGRRLEIMSDSHTGAFGATAIALVAVVQTASIGAVLLGRHELPLLVVPAFARLAPTFAAWLGKPAREGGLGRSVMGPPSVLGITVAGLTVGTCIWWLYFGYGLTGAGIGVGAVAVALVVPHVLSSQVGGVTGDIMGASVLICETVLFGAAAILWGA